MVVMLTMGMGVIVVTGDEESSDGGDDNGDGVGSRLRKAQDFRRRYHWG